MGVAQNALLGAGSAIGVAASKFVTNMKSAIAEAKDKKIAQATDADRAEMAAATAAYQKEKLKTIKLKTRQQQLKNKDLRAKNRTMKEKQTLKKEDKPNE